MTLGGKISLKKMENAYLSKPADDSPTIHRRHAEDRWIPVLRGYLNQPAVLLSLFSSTSDEICFER